MWFTFSNTSTFREILKSIIQILNNLWRTKAILILAYIFYCQNHIWKRSLKLLTYIFLSTLSLKYIWILLRTFRRLLPIICFIFSFCTSTSVLRFSCFLFENWMIWSTLTARMLINIIISFSYFTISKILHTFLTNIRILKCFKTFLNFLLALFR